MITSLATALIKESFILVLPGGYIFYCMFYYEKHGGGLLKTLLRTWKTGLFLCLLTVTGLVAIYAFTGYKTADIHRGWTPYIKAMLYCYGISGCAVPALIGLFYLWKRKTGISSWGYPLLLFLMITVPQIILYAPSGIVDRYLLPAMTGCAILAIYVYRRLKTEDAVLNGRLWKNISMGLGIAIVAACSYIAFDDSAKQRIVDFAFYLQGQGWQKMTAASSLQYLLSTVSTMAIAGIFAGIALLSCIYMGGGKRSIPS
jgi:hypothetical protein